MMVSIDWRRGKSSVPTVSQFGLNNVLYSEETYGADVKVLVSESVVRSDLRSLGGCKWSLRSPNGSRRRGKGHAPTFCYKK